jgi:hypothetical protein
MALAVMVSVSSCELTGEKKDDNTATMLAMLSFLPTTIPDGGTLIGEYNSAIAIPANATVTLMGAVKFNAGSSLTIGSGATIKGDTSSVSLLIIDRGAKIYANGTAAAPITFTSANTAGSRGSQDWGGIVINGRGITNIGGTPEGECGTGVYGGTDNADNSGVLNYVRIQFAGHIYTGTKELNGLTLYTVGSGTEIDYVQVHRCSDDGFEMFGGAVNLKHIVATANEDDQIDCVEGWSGKVQFAIADKAGYGDKVLEHDNNETSYTASPVTSPVYYNVTLVGLAGTKTYAHMRRGVQPTFRNVYVYGCATDSAFGIADSETIVNLNNALIEASGTSSHTVLSGSPTVNVGTDVTVDNAPATSYLAETGIDTVAHLSAASWVPQAGASNTETAATPPSDGFFDASATFIGAVQNSANNWTSGWTEYPVN